MEKPSRVFLSGPMSGIEDFNYPAFNALAAKIRAAGFTVLNPAENPKCETWAEYMKLAIAQLLMCDTVVQLPGWSDSKGAMCEYYLANDLDLQVISQADFEIFYLSKPEAPNQMPEWICHKRVRAAKIVKFAQRPNTASPFIMHLDNGTDVQLEPGWMKKHCPQVGGYFVEYKDGYHSYSPAEAFEEGYSPVPNMQPVTANQIDDIYDSLQGAVIKINPKHTPQNEVAHLGKIAAGTPVTDELIQGMVDGIEWDKALQTMIGEKP